MEKHHPKDYPGANSGTVAPIFGLMALVLLFVIGFTIDGSRAFRANTNVVAALDAAAMAAAKQMRLNDASDAELRTIAESYFAANLKDLGGSNIAFSNFTLSSDRQAGSVTVGVDAQLPTTIGRLMNIPSFEMARSATAIDESKDVELAMMLDVSGSMAGSRIADLKVAANDLVEILLNANNVGGDNRIAIAPYSTSVNAGSFSGPATGNYSGSNCVTERPGVNAFKDKGPNGGLLNKKTSSCPASEIVPLTKSESVLAASIDSMTANGWTAGHLGIAWAWYLISPEWASFWPPESTPRPYNDPTLIKSIVIMTDGEFNTAYESMNGSSKTQAEKLCDNIKAAGIRVYTVAFQAPATALPILEYCATSPNHFFEAVNGDALRAAFQEIAKSLSALRLAG